MMSRGAAQHRLRELRHRRNDGFGAAALLGGAATGALALGMPHLALVMLCGSLAGLGVGTVARLQRLDLLTRLVAQGEVFELPSVERHARVLVSPRQRLALARGLERAAEPGGVAPASRARIAAPALRRIARVLRDFSRPVEPRMVALTRAMLELGALSPLLNEQIAESELRRLLAAIQAGVSAA